MLGPYNMPTAEKDTGASDCCGLGALQQPVFQNLVNFAPDGMKINLAVALLGYVDLLLELNRYYSLDSVKNSISLPPEANGHWSVRT